jgi:hypothetical protein
MKRVVSMPLDGGGTVDLEITDDTPAAVMRGGSPQIVIERAVGTFESAVAKVKPVAAAVVEQFRDVAAGATSVKVKFGLKFNAAAGVIIASGGAEANFEVEVRWSQGGST